MAAKQRITQIERQERRVNVVWPLENDLPVVYANQFALYNLGDEAVLVVGHVLPTGLSGHDEPEIHAFLDHLEVSVGAKILMTQAGLHALRELLERNIQDSEAAR